MRQAQTMSGARKNKPKVFGIGWAKTGTTSLGQCFRILGYDHQGQNLSLIEEIRSGDLTRTCRIATSKDSFEDWPWILLFRELDKIFPGSRFVLTTRDADRWLQSYRAMLASETIVSERMIELRTFIYGMDVRFATDDQLRNRFSRHNHEVTDYFRARTNDLLVVDWEEGDGWSELCSFLDLPIPSAPFPRLNHR